MTKFLNLTLALLFLTSSSLTLSSQTYDFSFKKNKIDLAASILFWGGSHVYSGQKKTPEYQNLKNLDGSKLWSIDRDALNQFDETAETWSDITLFSSIAFPTVAMLGMSKDNKVGDLVLMGFHGFLIENLINHYTKIAATRPRPYVFDPSFTGPLEKGDVRSFYSGHTSTTAYWSLFGARIFSELHPESKMKPFVWGAALALPAVTAILRYKAGKHFPTDVITGYVMGGAIGYFLPSFYKNPNLTISATPIGIMIDVRI